MERQPQLGAEAFRNQVAVDRKSTPTAKQARRGDMSVRHTDLGRFDSGRLLRTYDLEREDARGSYDARARVTRRDPAPSQLALVQLASPDASASAMRAEGTARVERRVHIADRYCSSRAFVSKSDRRLFLVPGHVQPGARTHHARRVEDGCSSTCLSPDFTRASCTTLLCEGAVRNCAGLRAGPFSRSDLW